MKSKRKRLRYRLETSLIKAGQIFGGDGGEFFDDSLLPLFTYTHYLSGIILSKSGKFDACQFIYTSLRDNQSRIESIVHGINGRPIDSAYAYYLDKDERIEEVSVTSSNVTFVVVNVANSFYKTKVTKGLKFLTTKGRTIPSGALRAGGDMQSERFSGYTLGYATGRSGLVIDRLQFFWYRTSN